MCTLVYIACIHQLTHRYTKIHDTWVHTYTTWCLQQSCSNTSASCITWQQTYTHSTRQIQAIHVEISRMRRSSPLMSTNKTCGLVKSLNKIKKYAIKSTIHVNKMPMTAAISCQSWMTATMFSCIQNMHPRPRSRSQSRSRSRSIYHKNNDYGIVKLTSSKRHE